MQAFDKIRNTDRRINKLVRADCLEFLQRLETESIDEIVTDPPYGLKFLGSAWDRDLPPKAVWEECLRVLKPGGFAFVMSSPRMDLLYRMGQYLESAGFNVGFTPIFWAYASGLTKAKNISKAIDKRAVTTKEAKLLDGSYAGLQLKPAVEVIIVVMKPLSEKSYTEQALWNMKGITWLDDCRIPVDDGIEPRKKWEELSGKAIYQQPGKGFLKDSKGRDTTLGDYYIKGRVPANLLVSDEILDDGKIRTERKRVERIKPGKKSMIRSKKTIVGVRGFGDSVPFYGYFDLDLWYKEKLSEIPQKTLESYPFVLVRKPTPSEKNKGIINPQKQSNQRGVGVAFSKDDTIYQEDRFANMHPTVKPVKLMSYLITMGSRKGDIVLDPYIGSGTTAVAAKMLKRKYIGCDNDKEWLKIAIQRIKAVSTTASLSALLE